MAWCEANGVEYVLGLARNARLQRAIGGALHEAKERCEATGEPARSFVELDYRTKKTWSRTRRVVAKAEALPGKANPCFIVTSLPAERYGAKTLYETIYCARGDMENRIKEQQLDLFADRTSTATMRANQLRLFKIAALVRLSVRRIVISFSSVYPLQALFATVLANLQRFSPQPNAPAP